jgi:hypothetical protein
MVRNSFNAGVAALLLAASTAVVAAEPVTSAERASLAKPGETYVSLQVEGCNAKCPSFEIYVFDTGRITFRSNNEYTAAKGLQYKSGMQSVYKRISKYLQDSGAFAAKADCASPGPDPSVAMVRSVHDSHDDKASWSSGCADQIEKGRAAVKVFVNQTGMWRLINSDSRYWEKYWETWEEKPK